MAAADTEVEPMDSATMGELYTPGPDAVDITPDQDKGVLKEIIEPGEGVESPKSGNKVSVHYTGKLMDGTKFDSSRDRDELFEFTLGKGQVIKAWDVGVATMKKGEKCVLTCGSEYAYGKSGSPPKIPADATLIFEIELFKWTLEDLTTKCDNGVQRSIIQEGEGSDMPNDDATVEVHVIGKFNDTVFEDRELTFQLGEGDEHGIVTGLEIALKHFKKGENSRIILAPNYAFGSKGKMEFNIPPESEVEYEVTLKSFEKAKELWEMDANEKLEQSAIVKDKGTKYFKDGEFRKAELQYRKIVGFLQYETLEGDLLTTRHTLLLAGHLNLAACYLKLCDYTQVIESCDKALELEPTNAKGLFRRGQAHLAMKDYDKAEEDFKRVVTVEPDNKAAQNQILICRQKLRQEKEKEKQLYKNMFEKLAKYSEDESNKADPKGADPVITNEAEAAKA